MPVKSMHDLFVEELRDIYHAEKQITRALPKMAKAATTPELKQAFELHLEQTRGQIERLDQVFEQLDLPKRAKKCEAMEGLLEEACAAMEEIEDATVLDVGMIINDHQRPEGGALRDRRLRQPGGLGQAARS